MTSKSGTTTDHKVIRKWVEDRGGHPAKVRDSGDKRGGGVIRIDFDEPGGDDDSGRLERIEWDEWFGIFDESGLAFLHQDQKSNGDESTFSRLVKRDDARD